MPSQNDVNDNLLLSADTATELPDEAGADSREAVLPAEAAAPPISIAAHGTQSDTHTATEPGSGHAAGHTDGEAAGESGVTDVKHSGDGAAAASTPAAPPAAAHDGTDGHIDGHAAAPTPATESAEHHHGHHDGHHDGAATADETSAASAGSAEGSEENAPMEQLLEQYASPAPSGAEGKSIEGRVVAFVEAGVVVDVGGKLEGLIPAQELMELGMPLPFQAGQTIEVEKLGEVKDGYALLSHIRAHKRQVWKQLEQAHRDNTTLTGKVVDRIRGGLVLDIGVRAFLPASQLDMKPVHDLDAWKDQEVAVRILKLNRKRGNVVVSRRVLLEDEQKSKREAVMSTMVEGAVIHGKVKNITEYGAFVDLGGVDGLLHVSDMVWGRITHPSEILKPGDELDVQILHFDKDRGRISLGRKQLIPDPWASVPERMPAGSRVKGRIVSLTDYGAFVQLEPGIEGLVHISEMTWSRRMKHPSKIVKVGDEVEVAVLEVRPDIRRISLGLKQTQPDPWDGVAAKYTAGTLINGRVRNVTDFGAFVEIEDGVEGLIHIGDISWTERVDNPADKFKKGDHVEARVLKVDAEHRRLSLGIKQLHDPAADWMEQHHLDEIVRGKVTRLTTFGAFVELAPAVEGLCHISEIEERRSKGEREKQMHDGNKIGPLTPGQEYDFKIIKLDPEQRKISISYRAANKQAERVEMETYHAAKTATPKSSPTATIGDAIKAKLKTP